MLNLLNGIHVFFAGPASCCVMETKIPGNVPPISQNMKLMKFHLKYFAPFLRRFCAVSFL